MHKHGKRRRTKSSKKHPHENEETRIPPDKSPMDAWMEELAKAASSENPILSRRPETQEQSTEPLPNDSIITKKLYTKSGKTIVSFEFFKPEPQKSASTEQEADKRSPSPVRKHA